jgi:hypothetical protein
MLVERMPRYENPDLTLILLETWGFGEIDCLQKDRCLPGGVLDSRVNGSDLLPWPIVLRRCHVVSHPHLVSLCQTKTRPRLLLENLGTHISWRSIANNPTPCCLAPFVSAALEGLELMSCGV